MTRKMLIIISVIADALDLVLVGQIPGISLFLDLPVTACHVAYAGNAGWLTLVELVPLAGTVPFYTLAAFSYPDQHKAKADGVTIDTD